MKPSTKRDIIHKLIRQNCESNKLVYSNFPHRATSQNKTTSEPCEKSGAQKRGDLHPITENNEKCFHPECRSRFNIIPGILPSFYTRDPTPYNSINPAGKKSYRRPGTENGDSAIRPARN